ncbi:MAG: hypothetical protein U9Q82_10045, partial [Chloroflexota bacterium]|nr:hypothetical protein [Chloroflexota bacterium]
MMTKQDKLKVKVLVNGQKLQLPTEITDDDETLRKALSQFYPAAETADIKRTKTQGVETITVVKKAGTKGNAQGQIIAALTAAPEHFNPILAFHDGMQDDDIGD